MLVRVRNRGEKRTGERGAPERKRKTIAQTDAREKSFSSLSLSLSSTLISHSALTDESTFRVASVEPPLDLMMTDGILERGKNEGEKGEFV